MKKDALSAIQPTVRNVLTSRSLLILLALVDEGCKTNKKINKGKINFAAIVNENNIVILYLV